MDTAATYHAPPLAGLFTSPTLGPCESQKPSLPSVNQAHPSILPPSISATSSLLSPSYTVLLKQMTPVQTLGN